MFVSVSRFFFLGGVVVFLHIGLISVFKIIIVVYVILPISVVLILCGSIKVILKGIVKISVLNYTDRVVRSMVKLIGVEDMNEVEKNIEEMNRRAYKVNQIVPNVIQMFEDGSYTVGLVRNNKCYAVCGCVGHCT